MGNCASSSCVVPRSTAPSATLLHPEEPPRRIALPSLAAELMLEAPGHAVASAKELLATRRACALRADEPLVAGGVYLLVPVSQVGSRLSDSQLEAVLRAAKKGKAKRSRSGKRVVPVVAGGEAEGKDFSAVGLASQRPGSQRAWRPLLETIHESH